MTPEWDRFVRHALDAGRRVILTGSNASLLSRKLGSSLTGRQHQEDILARDISVRFNIRDDHAGPRSSAGKRRLSRTPSTQGIDPLSQ